MAGALALSLFFHLGLAAWAGGRLSRERPRQLRVEVDLKLIAPAVVSPPVATPTPPAPTTPPPAPAPPPTPAPPKKKPKQTKQPKPKPKAKSAKIKNPRASPDPEPTPIARALVPPSMDQGPSGAPSTPTPEPPKRIPKSLLANYQRVIHQRIKRAQRYPRQSRQDHEEGTVKIGFVISSSGSVRGVRVVKSSGFGTIDRAAVDAVKRAAPFPPLPSGIERSEISVTVPIRFTLK